MKTTSVDYNIYHNRTRAHQLYFYYMRQSPIIRANLCGSLCCALLVHATCSSSVKSLKMNTLLSPMSSFTSCVYFLAANTAMSTHHVAKNPFSVPSPSQSREVPEERQRDNSEKRRALRFAVAHALLERHAGERREHGPDRPHRDGMRGDVRWHRRSVAERRDAD